MHYKIVFVCLLYSFACLVGADDALLQPPVINIEPLFTQQGQFNDVAHVQKQILDAAQRWGFFYVINHGIDDSILNEIENEMKSFFALPKEIKYQIKRNENNSRGFADDELTKQLVDLKEVYDIGQLVLYTDLSEAAARDQSIDGENYWLPDHVQPRLKPAIEQYYQACYHLSSLLFDHLIGSLPCARKDSSSPSVLFQEHFRQHSSFLRLNYYPVPTSISSSDQNQPVTLDGDLLVEEHTSTPKKSTLGISRHTDAGALTILWQDPSVSSLEVYSGSKEDAGDGEWTPIAPIPHTLTVNIGDMLQVWSNNQLKAAEHRVRASRDKERYSMAYFLNPSYDSMVSPWLCEDEEKALESAGANQKIYQPIRWGNYRTQRYKGDFADVGKEIQIEEYVSSSTEVSRAA
jgi:isopenicillin N synthase-like dioxygenase